jgi:hypothetical protein
MYVLCTVTHAFSTEITIWIFISTISIEINICFIIFNLMEYIENKTVFMI